jgi:hypothetical protein
MPEQRKAEEAALHSGAKALDRDLRHHHKQPDQAESDVEPVASNKREEVGKKRAAMRACAVGDHPGELADLERQESGAENKSDRSKTSKWRDGVAD